MGLKGKSLFTRNYLLACLVTFFCFANLYLFASTMPLYVSEVSGKRFIGLVIGTFSLTTFVFDLIAGRLSDSLGRKAPLIAAGLLMAAASLGYNAATWVLPLLMVRILHGVGWSGFAAPAGALVADVTPRERLGEAMGYYGVIMYLAIAIAPPLGVFLQQNYGFPVLFSFAAGIGVAGFLVALPISGVARGPAGPRHSLIPFERSALFPAIILSLLCLSYGAVIAFLPLFAASRNLGNPGLFFTIYAIATMMGRGVAGRLSDRYGRAAVIIPGMALGALGMAVLAFSSSIATFLLAAFIYGLGFSTPPIFQALIVERVSPQARGVAMGMYLGAWNVGMGLGAFLWGYLSGFMELSTIFLVSGLAAAAGMVVFALRNRTRRASLLRTPG